MSTCANLLPHPFFLLSSPPAATSPEPLPDPAKFQQGRSYVAYIPVPIGGSDEDDEEDDEYDEDEYEDDEYYDEDEEYEYYYDDEEDRDDDDYDYEDDEDVGVKEYEGPVDRILCANA